MSEYTDMVLARGRADVAPISDCQDMMIRAFESVHIFRTETEMRGGILNPLNYPTNDAKYWQAIRELTVMSENLAENEFALREADLNLKLLALDMDEIDTVDERGKLLQAQKQVDIDRALFQRAALNREISRRIEEIRNWTRIVQELEPLVVCGITDPGRHQVITYIVEFARKLAMGGEPEAIENNFAKLIGMIDEIRRVGRIDELRQVVQQDETLQGFLRDRLKLEV